MSASSHQAALMIITACAILHSICLGVGDTMAQENKHEEDVAEDEGEHALEAASGAPWRDQLSAVVSAPDEGPADHNYRQIRPLYCRINLNVPMLDKFF
ncbi:hypothetical protein H4Q32_008811 [Labeo rohita]|uniref:Uncharacterized protein n=1 Tax=Labeo rohita TaxID=84645 RepID=A0ABQ8M3J2_LABRO|nr:hypothetical protein H4Q32_008811 [Labeo rohita]